MGLEQCGITHRMLDHEARSSHNFSLFVCPNCKNNYDKEHRTPQELNCKHTFCTTCIENLLRNAKHATNEEESVITGFCPICDEPLLMDATVSDFSKADYIFQIRDALGPTVPSVGPSSCQTCKLEQEAVCWCGHCRQEICQYCADVHTTMSSFKDHAVHPLMDRDIEKLKMIQYCEVHTQFALSHYCTTCQIYICFSCKELNHCSGQHDVSTLEEINKIHAEEFLQLVDYAQHKQTCSIKYINMAKVSEATLQTNVSLAVKNVYEIRKELDEMMDAWMISQLHNIKQNQGAIMHNIRSERERVFLSFNFLGHDLDYLKPLVHSDKNMAIKIAQEHSKTILEEMVSKEIPDQPMDSYLTYKLEPSKIACLPLILEGLGSVYTTVNLAKTSFEVPIILSNQNAEILVLPSDDSGSSSMGGLQLKVRIVVPSGDGLHPVTTLDNGDGSYTVRFKPSTSGLYKLNVSFPNQDKITLEHSFPVHDVSCQATTEVNEALDLMITPAKKTKADIIHKLNDVMTELVDPTGTKMQNTEKKYSGGMYIHRYKPIILGDHKMLLSLNGNLIGELHINVYQSWKWENADVTDLMAIESDYFLVCGRGKFNNDQVMKISSDGRHISNDDNMPEGCILLTVRPENKVYGLFKDADTHVVRCFDHTDQHWKQISNTEISGLKQPTAMVVSRSKYILVCDRKLNCIFMCSEESNVISRIGSKGKEIGKFNEPFDMCLCGSDEVIVCDTGNKRLQRLDLLGQCKQVFSQEAYSDCQAVSLTLDDDLVIVTTKQLHRIDTSSGHILQSMQLKCLPYHTGIGNQVKHKIVCLGNNYAVITCSIQGFRSSSAVLKKYLMALSD